MTLPEFHPSISPEMCEEIMAKLAGIEHDFGVRILFAIESGSRAWGFPSPDSDYDVRFVYVHPMDWYLSLTPGRDVIELPIKDDLDIGGWDLRKALNLLLKPNPVMLEWLSSPIRYMWRDADAAKLIALAEKTAHASACLHHYLHLGEGQWQRHVADRAQVNYKKYFYVLRPALAIRWVRLNPDDAPPMNIQAMSKRLDLDSETIADIAQLLELKAKARETGDGDRIPRIDSLIETEFEWARTAQPQNERRDLVAQADDLFRALVKAGEL
ncbi:MAG: nucleotidyltransferase domain-containing protein [Pseudomonadota bacterium]